MAGHSKWANIQHRKGRQDAKRGKLWTKIIREITVAARAGGADPDANPRLRMVWDKANAANMPKDNVQRAIAKGVGGYARPMPEAWMKRQAALVAERVKQADIVITTALIPGRPAPVLVTEDMVKSMKPGSVIVDMAAEQGGNCPLTERDQIVKKHGVTLIGYTNFPALVPADSSALYARNLIDFLKLIVDKEGKLVINKEDEIVTACLMCENGAVVAK